MTTMGAGTASAGGKVTRIEVRPGSGRADPRGDAVARAARAAGLGVDGARSCRVYLIEGVMTSEQIERLRVKLLADPVLDSGSLGAAPVEPGWQVVEVHPLPGVMDPAAQSVREAMRELLGAGAGEAVCVSTGWRYDLKGIGAEQARRFAESGLANRVVQGIHLEPWTPRELPHGHSCEFKLTTVGIRGKSDPELVAFSREAHLFLSLEEMKAIRGEYERLGRDPTDIELETIAQTWSEHCVHKTLKSKVRYRESGGAAQRQGEGAQRAGPAGAGAPAKRGGGRMEFDISFGKPGMERTVAQSRSGDDAEDREPDVDPAGPQDLIAWEGRPGHRVGSDGTVEIDNLLKSTVAAATFELIEEGVDWTLSVFKDNSGVIEFDEAWGVCIKVETHNRPSAIEPYGGAATGAGGCIRDVIGTGLGAKPIASTDVFCVARPESWRAREENTANAPARPGERAGEPRALPPGTLHPRRVLSEVVGGVRDYGNRMGIPTVSGAVHFDNRYIGNPLVFCGCIGVIPRELVSGAARAGDRIIALGGRTGRDGIHGATFSSAQMEHTHADEFAHAVQIGNAIEEKRVLDAILRARDAAGGPLYHGLTDCGAGGFSSAIGEMGKDIGAEVMLEKAPLKYAGLSYTEVWISEAQERMVLAVPAENVAALQGICDQEGVELADLGVFGTEGGVLRLSYRGQRVGELSMAFLHDGLPQPVREAVWNRTRRQESQDPLYTPDRRAAGVGANLLSILSHPTVASKHWIIRQYDHEVQGNTVLKPLVGPAGRGPGDASVLEPVAGSGRGLAIGCGLATGVGDPREGGDPYLMAIAGIDECVRNLVCVGANPARIAILDNFCWPSCEKPENLGALVRAAEGCYDGAKAYRTPFVSGKDSLNNQLRYEDPVSGEQRVIEIPPTLLITGIGIVGNIRRAVTMDAKKAGNVLMLVGRTGPEMAGSVFAEIAGLQRMDDDAARVPAVDLNVGPASARAVAQLIQDGLVLSAHDCSDGGLLAGVAEMLIGAYRGEVKPGTGRPGAAAAPPESVDVGAVIQGLLKPQLSSLLAGPAVKPGDNAAVIGAELSVWDDMLSAEQTAFAESPSRYLLEVKAEDVQRVRTVLVDHGASGGGVMATVIGKLTSSGRLVWPKGDVDLGVSDLAAAWLGPLDW